MATARQPEPQPSLVPIGIIASALAAGVATYFYYPGVAVLWLGLIITGFLARPPQLTGPKDPTTLYPTVGNPGEGKKLASYRFWVQSRTALMIPKGPWPFAFSDLAAVGAGLVAFTLPATEPNLMMVWVNAAAAYLTVSSLTRMRRDFAAEESEPVPATEVRAWVAGIGTDQKVTASLATSIIFGVGTGFVIWWWLAAADWYLIQPPLVTGLGAAVLVIAGVCHSAIAPDTRLPWKQTVEARAEWKMRWLSIPKIKETPTLLSHRRVGENGEGWVDIFRAGADGSEPWIPMPDMVRPALPANTVISFMSTSEHDPEGQEIIPSRSAREFKVISWRGGETPNITDTAIDPDVLATWLELVISEACIRDSGPTFDLIPLGTPQALHAEDSPHAVWMVEYAITDPTAANTIDESMLHLANIASSALGAEIYPFGSSFAIGPVMDDATKLSDESMRKTLEAEREREQWKQRWKDMSPLQAPSYFTEYNETVEVFTTHSSAPLSIEKRWFIAPNGLEVGMYMDKINTEKLRTGLGTVQWATMSHVVQNRSRVPGGIAVYWSKQPVPRNPAEIEPSDRREASAQQQRGRAGARPARMGTAMAKVSDGAKWVITGQINEGFLMAKLAIPEIVSIQPLTSPDSDIHIWDIDMRLHGGVTVAEVKRAREKIRLTLGTEWLRVTESSSGARIAVGAPPTHSRVKWRNDKAREIATRLDWEQAFFESKVVNTGAQVPTLTELSTLPKNELVSRMVFRMPAGISISDVRSGREKLGGATENSFVDVRPGDRANEVVVLAATESPMPDLAKFDWDEVHQSNAVPFATGIEGEPVVFDPMVSPHMLFLGDSGTGKSAALQAILTPAAIRGWEIYLLDSVKGAADFKYLFPYSSAVATNDFTVAAALKMIYKEVQRRKNLNTEYGTSKVADLDPSIRPRHMVVMIDELLSAVTQDPVPKLSGDESEDELRDIEEKRSRNLAKRETGVALGRIAREARSAGVSIIAASQSLTKDETEKAPGVFDVKKQAARVLLGKSNYGQRAGAFKNPDSAPELGESVPRGRGIFESSEGAPLIFQAWYDAPHHVDSMLEQIEMMRGPEPHTLSDQDLMATVAKVTVFGERIDAGTDDTDGTGVEEMSIDMGEISLDSFILPDDDEDDDFSIPIIGGTDNDEPASTNAFTAEPVLPVSDLDDQVDLRWDEDESDESTDDDVQISEVLDEVRAPVVFEPAPVSEFDDWGVVPGDETVVSAKPEADGIVSEPSTSVETPASVVVTPPVISFESSGAFSAEPTPQVAAPSPPAIDTLEPAATPPAAQPLFEAAKVKRVPKQSVRIEF